MEKLQQCWSWGRASWPVVVCEEKQLGREHETRWDKVGQAGGPELSFYSSCVGNVVASQGCRQAKRSQLSLPRPAQACKSHKLGPQTEGKGCKMKPDQPIAYLGVFENAYLIPLSPVAPVP